MLIVLEGLDGAGKSTQVARLKEYLLQRCGGMEYIHFPRYDAPVYGELIGSFLRGAFGDINAVHPQLVALLYAEDRHGAAPQLRQAIAAGKPVLLDRYVYSNVAYQCAKLSDPQEREALREWILNTEFGAFDLPRPDLNLFLDVPLSFVEAKLSAHRQGADRSYLGGSADIHEASIAFQKAVRDVYVRQASLDPKFTRIDCADSAGAMLPPDAIFERIRSAVDPFLEAL